MIQPNILPLALGLVIFSFLVSSVFVVPFIDYLYKLRITRRKEGDSASKDDSAGQKLFNRLHDKKAGTPTGGGILVVILVSILFALLFPLISFFGVFIKSAHSLNNELFVIFFTFISFGLLGLLDDIVKTFGKPKPGPMGAVFGISSGKKFTLQWILGGIVAWWLYAQMGIHILHIPVFNYVLNLGIFYVPFAAFVIVFFANAFNISDGLDGLAPGLLMIYLFAYIIMAAGVLDTPLFIFIALWLGSIIAFLYFNVWPARVWLGDAGALSFGAMIAVIGLLVGNVFTLFIIGGVFVVELASSAIQILSYKIRGKGIFPLAPIHHTFLTFGWEEPKIVMRAWLVAVMLAVFGLWLATI